MSEWTRDLDADEADMVKINELHVVLCGLRGPFAEMALQYIARVRELTAEVERLRGEIRRLMTISGCTPEEFAARIKAREGRESINEMQMRLYHEQSKRGRE